MKSRIFRPATVEQFAKTETFLDCSERGMPAIGKIPIANGTLAFRRGSMVSGIRPTAEPSSCTLGMLMQIAHVFSLRLWLRGLAIAAVVGLVPILGRAEDASGDSISSGFVVVDGRYLAPPYVVVRQDDDSILVNDLPFDVPSPRLRRPGMRRWRPATRLPFGPAERVERLLLNDGLVVRLADGTVGLFSDSYPILQALQSDEPRTEKLRTLTESDRGQFTLEQWGELLDAFQRSSELAERLEPPEGIAADVTSYGGRRAMSYIVTVVGMLLVVYSFGTVLLFRPPLETEPAPTADSAPLVMRCVVLIGILSIFDLACTHWAGRSGGLWEMNPLGAALLETDWSLTGFKTGLTVTAMAILFRWRSHRLMQVTSWWLCLVLALVTARWVIFNSMFL